EDGIRDATVTGVQTCALPICVRSVVRIYLGPPFFANGECRMLNVEAAWGRLNIQHLPFSIPPNTNQTATGRGCSSIGRAPALQRSEERRVGDELRTLCVRHAH